jgi:hypothetical protein
MARFLSFVRRTALGAAVIAVLALMSPVPVSATVATMVRGGGVVDGPMGVTSQLGLVASDRGGSFLCVMAGRSGGFTFGPWDEIRQMQVQGPVTPGTLTVNGAVTRFEGIADIHVVGISRGSVLKMTVSDVGFVSTQGAGGAGVAWHLLEIPDLGLAFGPAPMKSGHISIGP